MSRVIAFDPAELSGFHPLRTSRGCDFCATGTPRWKYPARNIGLGTLCYGNVAYRSISLGHWVACWECSELIEAGDWPALARRTLRSLELDLSQARPGLRVRLLAWTHHAQEQFGEPTPEAGKPPLSKTELSARHSDSSQTADSNPSVTP